MRVEIGQHITNSDAAGRIARVRHTHALCVGDDANAESLQPCA
jgi:hypothetical protein